MILNTKLDEEEVICLAAEGDEAAAAGSGTAVTMDLAQRKLGSALREAMGLAQGGRLDAAEAALGAILKSIPNQPDALQLLGMIARRRGDHAAAVSLFRRSLTGSPAQPHVLNNLGNSLQDLGRGAEAVEAYRAAIRLQPSFAEAQANLATALLAKSEAEQAIATLLPLVAQEPGHARGWALLGQARRAVGELDEAIEAFRTSLRLRADHLPTMHNLAVTYRLSGDAGSALPLLLRCAAIDPNLPEIHYNLGHCLQDLNRFEEAAAAYNRTIKLDPTNRGAHDSLNRLLWQKGREDAHLASYREALKTHPRDQGLLSDFAHRLNLEKRHEEVVQLLEPAAGAGGAELSFRLGQAYWGLGRADAAFAQYEAALAIEPTFAAAAREWARALIIAGRPESALDHIANLLAADPADQQALALQGLGWRFTGDPREQWLNDERFIDATILQPGGNPVDFNASLDEELTGLHLATRSPLEQTLRGGTQTTDDLFARNLPQIQAVRALIATGVQRYIDALPYDAHHPFLRRKGNGFAFSGSWSVRLRHRGFHENHIHPEGWISACYYVAVPEAVARGHQGWLKLGETGLRLGARERLIRMVKPEPGLLVLFPSYVYHGTVPFEDPHHRTTIAFDVVPSG